MAIRSNLTDKLKKSLSGVAERSRVLGQALKVRADMAATRRRLRASYAAMGEELYTRLQADNTDSVHIDSHFTDLAECIDTLKAELKELEEELRLLMQTGIKIEPDDIDDHTAEENFGASTDIPEDK
jgi:chromosome segregation ATPase